PFFPDLSECERSERIEGPSRARADCQAACGVCGRGASRERVWLPLDTLAAPATRGDRGSALATRGDRGWKGGCAVGSAVFYGQPFRALVTARMRSSIVT